MESEFLALWMFLALTIWLMAGFQVCFTLLGTALIFGILGPGWEFYELLPMRIWGTMENMVLIAVPLFVFMGVTLEKSGLAEELLDTMGQLFGPLRGGLAISAVVVGALLGASTGIVGATVVTMGLLAVPTMMRRGYSKSLAAGTVAASGTLGQIIPPSIVLVLLATIVQVPVGDLFVAAVIPGMVLVGLYTVFLLILTMLRPGLAPPVPREMGPGQTSRHFYLRVLKALVPPLLLITAVLGSIFAGIASPTEAASVGCVGALVLTALNGKFSMEMLRQVMTTTTRLTCMVFIIMAGAAAFGLTFRELYGDELVREFLVGIAEQYDKWTIFGIVMFAIFLMGFLLDFIEITFIFVPVLVPILVQDMGFDPLWICVILAVNLQTSFMTPPFGFSLFYLKAVVPSEMKTGDIYLGVAPFIALQAIGLIIVVLWPEIATWLPSVVYD